jgi:hypothetical protein
MEQTDSTTLDDGAPKAGLDPVEATAEGICLECGQRSVRLYRHIPTHMRVKAYLKKYNLPPTMRLMVKSQLVHNRGIRTGHKRPLDGWAVARMICRGITTTETGQALGKERWQRINALAKTRGLSFGAPFFCDLGEPFRYGAITEFLKRTGFRVEDFLKWANLPSENVTERQPDRARKSHWMLTHSLSGEPKKLGTISVIGPFVKKRDEAIHSLLAVPGPRKAYMDFRQDEILKTILPSLIPLNRALLSTFPEIRNELAREEKSGKPWVAADLSRFVDERAYYEVNRGSGDSWQRTLMYLAPMEDKPLVMLLERLRQSPAKSNGPIVRELIGSKWGATGLAVQRAMLHRTKILKPEKIQAILFNLESKSASRLAERESADLRVELEKMRSLVPKAKTKKPKGPEPKPEERKSFRIRGELEALRPLFQKALERKRARNVPRKTLVMELTKDLKALNYTQKEISDGVDFALESKSAKSAARRFIEITEGLSSHTVKDYDLGRS